MRQHGRRVGLEHASFAHLAPRSTKAVERGVEPMGGDAPDRWVRSNDYYGTAAEWQRTGEARLVPAGAEIASWKAQYPRAQRAMTWRERAASRASDAARARRAAEVAATGGGRRRVEPGRSDFGLTDGRAKYRN